jgi:lipopolysaccharide transport system ATP-binding protein
MVAHPRTDNLRVVAQDQGPADEPGTISKPDRRNLAIEIKNASVQYPIGAASRGSLKSAVLGLFGHRNSMPQAQYVDAITDLDLTVTMGERIGVIGANGSGKSTLLRAMAGVYPLKSGTIQVLGQIGTLLDVALGFESESTGRENIYYRGMAMGYSRRDMAAVEAEVIEFAGLGDFIDLPMRTYSTGMYVRLGFAVSTQFHPDVLLVDEVFGAGDAAFAERAIARMRRIVDAAGIMVMASHDMSLMQQMCTRVLWMNRGKIVRDGPPSIVVPQFHDYMTSQSS